MNRRTFLAKSGLALGSVAGVSGILWRATQNDLLVSVLNLAEERKRIVLSIRTSDEDLVYRDSFTIPSTRAVNRTHVAGPGEYLIDVAIGDNHLERPFDTRFCHDPFVEAEIDRGNAISMGASC